MSDKGLSLQFILKCETKLGEEIYITGAVNELGNWDKCKCPKLNTTPSSYPLWESDFIKFNNKYTNLEYKFFIRKECDKGKDNEKIYWEEFHGNRKLDMSNINEGFNIIYGEFSNISFQKIETLEEKFKVNNINDINDDIKNMKIDDINNNKNDHFSDKENNIENSDEVKVQETNTIGLQNIGSTCYMNATLQCFCHIAKFVSFFKKKFNRNILSNDSLSVSFKNLIDNLWNDELSPNKVENNYYIPTDFRKKIANKSILFENNEANDAKDLVNFIIMTLHEELNKVKNINIPNNNCQNCIVPDQTNKDLIFKIFVNDFMKNNQSIISDIFYAMNLSVTQCSFCQNKLYNYQIYYFIVFPLEEVRKFKYQNSLNNFQIFNNNMNMNIIPSNEVSIYDCFDYERKVNYMIGQNKMYCNFCKTNRDCMMKTTLVTGPDVLILLLNRGKGLEFKVKINFVEYLNLEHYIEIKNTGYNYELFGVITHIGENGQGGHFIAYCRDPFTNVWSKYNDAIVTEVKDFQNDIINFANPYLLFYQKLKT